MKYCWSLLILLIVFSCKNQAQEQTKVEIDPNALMENWNTHTNDTVRIKYPTNWQLQKSGPMGTSFIIFAPKIDSNDAFQENINLLKAPLPIEKLDLNMVKTLAQMEIKRRSPEADIKVLKKVIMGDQEAVKCIFTAPIEGYNLKFQQYYIIGANGLNVLTYTAEKEAYNAYHTTAEQIMGSFEILLE